jgi:hypothetical protein
MTGEVILFPDATAVVIDLLAAAFDERDETAPVEPRVPNPRPDRFVVVRRTGGTSRAVVIDDPQITVEAWGTDDADAHDLAQLCRGLLHAAEGTVVDTVAVYRVAEVSGPGNLPDPESNHARYSQTFLAAMRGTAEPIGS